MSVKVEINHNNEVNVRLFYFTSRYRIFIFYCIRKFDLSNWRTLYNDLMIKRNSVDFSCIFSKSHRRLEFVVTSHIVFDSIPTHCLLLNYI